jgi:hypothetical protein
LAGKVDRFATIGVQTHVFTRSFRLFAALYGLWLLCAGFLFVRVGILPAERFLRVRSRSLAFESKIAQSDPLQDMGRNLAASAWTTATASGPLLNQ